MGALAIEGGHLRGGGHLIREGGIFSSPRPHLKGVRGEALIGRIVLVWSELNTLENRHR